METDHPILSRLTSLTKPRAGLPPVEHSGADVMRPYNQSPEAVEAGIKGDLDAELHRDEEIKRLAHQPANLPHPEKAVGFKAPEPLKTFTLTLSPLLRVVTVQTQEGVETVITQDGTEIKATLRF